MKFIVLFILFVVSNGFWLYHFLDKGTSLEHSKAETKIVLNEAELLFKLLEKLRIENTYSEIETIAEKYFQNSVVKKTKYAISIDSVVIIFEGQMVNKIKSLNHLTTNEYKLLN